MGRNVVYVKFADKMVTFDTFVNAVAYKVAGVLAEQKDLPEWVSQRKAFRLCGQGNVLRWRKQGKIEPRITPGKLEYNTAELLKLKNVVQDYF